MIVYLKAGALRINGCFREHRGVHKKNKNKNGLRSHKKYTKSHKNWTTARLKIHKGKELGGNHDM